ncbi:tetratricopeptide repeat protein [Lentzea sp. BCCO 10_0061]|uniref:Tetratricopeptide repeat protein n=1 Tax=Lentzea sokolovensis TaxID=3095429 RepID=A0ABU4V633_9PSEU|nr:tetratricopeptide repeat protein [Lentzea sp. BCCO 10_0061]MDX8147251.1 tetratricopeptide repeat protein [Lentzea sp. BCCO 10_0061]
MSEPDLGPLSRHGSEMLDSTTDQAPHERAIEVLEQAVAAGEPAAARLLALGYLEQGRLIEAHELLGPLVAAGRDDLADVLADVLADLDLTDDAENAYLLAVASGDSKAMNNFALFLAEQGRFDEAVGMFERAVALGDTLAPANLARLHLHDRHDVDTALAVAEQHLDAARPTTYCALAEVYAELGRLDEAERLLRAAIDLDAQQAHIDYAKFLHRRRDDLAAAEREYRAADELGEPAAGYHLGAFLLEHGDEDEAAGVLERAASWGDLDARQLLDTEFELVTDP